MIPRKKAVEPPQGTKLAPRPVDGLAKVVEAAAFLSVTRQAVYRMLKEKQLTYCYVRDEIRVKWTELHAIVDAGKR